MGIHSQPRNTKLTTKFRPIKDGRTERRGRGDDGPPPSTLSWDFCLLKISPKGLFYLYSPPHTSFSVRPESNDDHINSCIYSGSTTANEGQLCWIIFLKSEKSLGCTSVQFMFTCVYLQCRPLAWRGWRGWSQVKASPPPQRRRSTRRRQLSRKKLSYGGKIKIFLSVTSRPYRQ